MYNAGRNKVKAMFYDRSETEDIVNDVGEYEQKPKLICIDWIELLPQTGREFIPVSYTHLNRAKTGTRRKNQDR